MSGRRQGLIALQRWRDFGEQRAAMTRQGALRTQAESEAATAAARQQAQQMAAQQLGWMQQPVLDLARLQAAARMADAAWDGVSQCETRQQHAEQAAEVAREEHEQAHRMREAVRERRERVEARERDDAEKRLFDTLAELRTVPGSLSDDR